MEILPIIMAGGSGTRLWPLSRLQYPKQFLPLSPDGTTLLQSTVLRIADLHTSPALLICNEEHRFLAAEQLRQIGKECNRILLEPEGRNTAPAIALAALEAMRDNADAMLLILAADHLIGDDKAFHQAVQVAIPLAQRGSLVTFGITPSRAETGYGYIEKGDALTGAFKINRFIEKPDQNTAEYYLKDGNFLWNSGIFLFKASRYLNELGQHAPAILEACQRASTKTMRDGLFIRIDKDAFSECPANSIDYAVMEHTSDAVVVPLNSTWSDIGSWSSLWDVHEKDENGNVLQGDVITHCSTNNFIRANSRLVTTIGINNLILVETKDAILVAHKEQTQEVKKVVEQLKKLKRSEYINHREVFRPWGAYDSIDSGQRYQVKRITVKPGAKLSVQMHHHRAEHWIVVSGTARITKGEETFILTENQSTYIPVGQVHALENPGRIPLEIIEVQSGAYLGEDDIIRFEDIYGRT